jgi:hypothetical protein
MDAEQLQTGIPLHRAHRYTQVFLKLVSKKSDPSVLRDKLFEKNRIFKLVSVSKNPIF